MLEVRLCTALQSNPNMLLVHKMPPGAMPRGMPAWGEVGRITLLSSSGDGTAAGQAVVEAVLFGS